MSQVRDNRDESRFELEEEGQTAIAAYDLSGETIRFTHTVVPMAIEGRGVGGRLIRGALDEARSRGLKVVPVCSFVRSYIGRHPEMQDLVA